MNARWKSEGRQVTEDNITVMSLDAEALYPSLDVKQCSKLCGELIENSELLVRGVDYKWASLYVALNMTQIEVNREGLQGLVP